MDGCYNLFAVSFMPALILIFDTQHLRNAAFMNNENQWLFDSLSCNIAEAIFIPVLNISGFYFFLQPYV